MDKLQISQIIKELVSRGYPEPIIGGTCSLFLQGFDIEPGDIDLYYAISKEDFLHQIHYRRCPKFPISIDWNFYPNLDLKFQEIEIEGIKLRVQKIEDVLNYKLEGLEEDYFPESKRNKHLKFFKELISDPRVSSKLKLRINQILNIMRVEDLCVECRVSDILEFFKQESPLSGGKGPLTPERKKEIEDRLSNEANKFKGMWCVPGDYPSEGAPRSNPEMRPHRKAVKSIVKDMISKDSKLGWDDGYGAIYAPKAIWKKALNQYEKSQKEFHDSLGSIKEQLFDAPDEVKAAFNTVVGWFDDKLPEKLSLSGIYHEWKGPMGLERQSASELSGYFKGIQEDTYKEYKNKSKEAIYSRFKTAVEFFKKSEGSQTGALADTLVGLVKAYNEK